MRYNVAVVVANQVSDKFAAQSTQSSGEPDEVDVLSLDFQARWFTGWEEKGRGKVPALGMVWTNCLNARIAIYKDVGEAMGENGLYTDFWKRRLKVVFAPWVEAGAEVEFVIEKGGLRGLEDDREARVENDEEEDAGTIE
jgi:hypothetical protein